MTIFSRNYLAGKIKRQKGKPFPNFVGKFFVPLAALSLWFFLAALLLVAANPGHEAIFNKKDAKLWQSVNLNPGEKVMVQFKSSKENLNKIAVKFGTFRRISTYITFRIREVDGYWFFQDTINTERLMGKEMVEFNFLNQKNSKNKIFHVELESTAPISTSISPFIVAGFEDLAPSDFSGFLTLLQKKAIYFFSLINFYLFLIGAYVMLIFLGVKFKYIFTPVVLAAISLNYFLNDHRLSVVFILLTALWLVLVLFLRINNKFSFFLSFFLAVAGTVLFLRFNVQIAREVIWWSFIYFVIGVAQESFVFLFLKKTEKK